MPNSYKSSVKISKVGGETDPKMEFNSPPIQLRMGQYLIFNWGNEIQGNLKLS